MSLLVFWLALLSESKKTRQMQIGDLSKIAPKDEIILKGPSCTGYKQREAKVGVQLCV